MKLGKKDLKIKFNVVAIDFAGELGEDSDDSDSENETDGPKEECKAQLSVESKYQTENKDLLIQLTEDVKGVIFPANIAM